MTALAASLVACSTLGNGGSQDGGDPLVATVTVPPGESVPDSGAGAQSGVEGGVERNANPEAPGAGVVGPVLERIVATLPQGSGVALAPVGRSAEATAAGDLQSEVAWSSIKVPLAIAALRADPSLEPQMVAAITVSDNDAAQALWDGLGGGVDAASAVMGVLREGGDATTAVPSERLREGYTVFGQTQWPLAEQARFGAGLPCIADSGAVLGEMGRVSVDQRWGLGRLDGARFKGGWGPSMDGGYLARQFGIVPAGGGEVAVAIMARAADFGSATQVLDGIAESVRGELGDMPGGTCA